MPAYGDAGDKPNEREDTINPAQMFAICLSVCTEGVQITIPYVIGVYMIRSFEGPSPDESRVGRLTGTLTSCFCAAQFLTAYCWGLASDQIGRKKLVLMSNLSSTVFSVFFGLSNSYWWAASVRFAQGFFNCVFGNVRAMVADSLIPDTQATALGFISMSWGLGAVLGPVLGGAFAFPCDSYGNWFPLCGEGQLFRRREFLLPCLVASSLSLLASASSALVLPETLPRLVAVRQARARARSWSRRLAAGGAGAEEQKLGAPGGNGEDVSSSKAPGSPQSPPAAGVLPIRTAPIPPVSPYAANAGETPRDARPWLDRFYPGPAFGGSTAGLAANPNPVHEARGASASPRAASLGSAHSSGMERMVLPQAMLQEGLGRLSYGRGSPAADLTAPLLEGGGEGKEEEGSRDAEQPWYRNGLLLLLVAGYGLVAFLFNIIDEVTPLFAATPVSKGGLGFTSSELSVPLAAGGAVLMVWAVTGYPWVQRRFGPLPVCRSGLLAAIPLSLAIPASSYAAASKSGAMVALTAAMGLRNLAGQNAFSSSMIMINLVAPATAMGAVNGAAQTLAAFVRAVGPALGGLSWALSLRLAVPGHQFLAFACVSAGLVATRLLYGFVRLPGNAYPAKIPPGGAVE
ncbi:hypothetical protein WJX81_003365 [Elliptochloris bilobata]|uniref:Major facilitator superfamily (MFS) profile domain-containing protein n=1 Tax=Elliptochloris bilobata TaxID=381761 RepID=A0AAW1RGY2_9CHLO